MADGSGTTRFYYDDRGRVKEVIRTVDGVAYSVKTEYDSMDRARKITYPAPDNAEIVYDYDAGALSEVKNGTGTKVYATYSNFTALGQPRSVVHGNNGTQVTTTYEYYEKSDRLRTIHTMGQGDLQSYEYEYNEVGNITRISDLMNCPQSQSMEYDGLNRLTLGSANAPQSGKRSFSSTSRTATSGSTHGWTR